MGYMDGNWQYVPYHFIMSDTVRPLTYEGKPPTLKIHVATLQNGWPSIQLSSHDDGNDGTWPEKGNLSARKPLAFWLFRNAHSCHSAVLFRRRIRRYLPANADAVG